MKKPKKNINSYKLKLEQNYIYNPTQNSVAIYREGDRCPDFSYNLFSHWSNWFKLNNDMVKDSGLLQIPNTYPRTKMYDYRFDTETELNDNLKKYILTKIYGHDILFFWNIF